MDPPRRSPGVLVLGANDHGQLATPALDAQRRVCTATAVPSASWGVSDVAQVACGRWHTVVASAAGGVYTAGDNGLRQGRLGRGEDVSARDARVLRPLHGLDPATSVLVVSAGEAHSAVLTHAGQVYAWGYNHHGQCGVGTTAHQPSAALVRGALDGQAASYVACGANHTMAITTHGRLAA